MTCVLGMVVRREREIRCFCQDTILPCDLRISHWKGRNSTVNGGQWKEAVISSLLIYTRKMVSKKRRHAQEADRFPEHGAAAQMQMLTEIEQQEKKTRIHRFFLTWRSFRMTAPSCSRSARMRLSVSRRNSMRRNWSLIRERTPECFLPQYQRKFTRISAGLRNYPAIGSYRSRSPSRWEATRRSRRHDMSMTSRSQITMRSFRPVRDLNALNSLPVTSQRVYETIVRRFLCIFCPPAVYQKVSLVTMMQGEKFFSSFKVLQEEGYLKDATNSFARKEGRLRSDRIQEKSDSEDVSCDAQLLAALHKLKKGDILTVDSLDIKEGETSPPKRYNSGSHDPCNGKCRTAHRGRGTACADQGKRDRNECDQGRDPEKAFFYQISCP